MVSRTPPKQQKQKMVAPLNPILLRETLIKVDKCMARLQELQYTVAGGKKVISGVSLSPRSTRGYLRTSLRCKQESLRIKNSNSQKSPPRKFPTNTGEWRRMSLPAMILGETVAEIIQASQFAKEIVESVASSKKKPTPDDPKTPPTLRRNQRPNPTNSDLQARRNKEKQTTRSQSDAPSLQRAKSRINFKVSSPLQKREIEKENAKYLANRVSPKNRPWAKKTVIFPNPLFHSSPTSHHQKFCRTKSPLIGTTKGRETPHKFFIKSPKPLSLKINHQQVRLKSPPLSVSPTSHHQKFCRTKFPVIGTTKGRETPHKFLIKSLPLSVSPTRATSLGRKSPKLSTAAKIRRSFSPSRLANKLVSPLKSRKSVQNSDGMLRMMSGLKQRPTLTAPLQFSARRI